MVYSHRILRGYVDDADLDKCVFPSAIPRLVVGKPKANLLRSFCSSLSSTKVLRDHRMYVFLLLACPHRPFDRGKKLVTTLADSRSSTFALSLPPADDDPAAFYVHYRGEAIKVCSATARTAVPLLLLLILCSSFLSRRRDDQAFYEADLLRCPPLLSFYYEL